MSKFTDEFESQHKDVGGVRRRTKEVLEQGEDIALKEIHEASSVERLKKLIRKG